MKVKAYKAKTAVTQIWMCSLPMVQGGQAKGYGMRKDVETSALSAAPLQKEGEPLT